VEQLVETGAVNGIVISGPREPKQPGDQACTGCLAGKMHESFHKTTDTRATRPLERIHVDISGIKSKSSRGNRYFLLFVDDYSRHYWIYLLKSKETPESVTIFKQFKAMVERQTRQPIVFFRSDNGPGEFGPKLILELKTQGIQFEPSVPYKHSMNGVVEKAIELINRRIRSMIYEAKLPDYLWDYAAEHAAYLRNRVLTAAVKKKTPIEAYTGEKPMIRKLRIFGCAVYPIVPKELHPPKHDPRIKDSDYILVGMKGSSIYRLFSLREQKEKMAANVAFNKYLFPASQLGQYATEPYLQTAGQLQGHPQSLLQSASHSRPVKLSAIQSQGQQATAALGAVSAEASETRQGSAGHNAPGTTTQESDRGALAPLLWTVSELRPEYI
jgi:hypothetical protein